MVPAALAHSVRLVRRLQYQLYRSWYDPAETRTPDLPAPEQTHSTPSRRLVLAANSRYLKRFSLNFDALKANISTKAVLKDYFASNLK